MKRRLKQIKRLASALMTIASVIVMILALCIVDMKEFTWTPIIVILAAVAWLWHVLEKHSEKGGEGDGMDR